MALRSFLEIAKDSDFPIQNLPFGVFQPKQDRPRVGVAIGDLVFDLSALEELGHFQSPEFQGRKVFSEESLNSFLALGRPAWRKTREILQHLLAADAPILRDDPIIRRRVLHAQKGRHACRQTRGRRLLRNRLSSRQGLRHELDAD